MRKYQPKVNLQYQDQWTIPQIPLNAAIGIYARQSTAGQVKNAVVSTEMQTDDLKRWLLERGVSEDNIILFTQDLAKSGRLRIDEREGLSALFAEIEKGIVKAILVFLEDRLFRDEKQIQPNIFIDFCRQHNVLVITPHMIYDFNIDQHRKLFRWKCEQAADYLRDYVVLRLNGAKNYIAEKGLYDGRRVALGFIVDKRKTIIVDGTEVRNPTYKKYIEYQPHAEIVRRIFVRFIQLGGKFMVLYRELCQERVLFPAFTGVDSQEIGSRSLIEVDGGYHISKAGLRDMLTNIAYVGYWVFHGKVHKSNHASIVDEGLFWYAFNRLSAYTIDGKENTERPIKVRYQRQKSTVIPALLKDIIETSEQGRVVYVGSKSGVDYYYLTNIRPTPDVGKVNTAQVGFIDTLFAEKLLEHLKDSNSYTHYQRYLKKREAERVSKEKRVNEQIVKIDEACLGLQESLRKRDLHPKVRERLEQDLADLLTDKETMQQSIDEPKKGEKVLTLDEYDTLVRKLGPHWRTLSLAKRKMLVEATTKRVLLDAVTPHFLQLTTEWDNPSWGKDQAIIWRKKGSTPVYLQEENQIIRDYYPFADRTEILSLLPQRTWNGIIMQAMALGVTRERRSEPKTIPGFLTMADCQFMKEHSIPEDILQTDIQVLWSLP